MARLVTERRNFSIWSGCRFSGFEFIKLENSWLNAGFGVKIVTGVDRLDGVNPLRLFMLLFRCCSGRIGWSQKPCGYVSFNP